ncbi:hypothetical protein HOE425_331131 [Hoeflea sp. EC-HK425]|nr:hypothetical protein HOE425_331131 [Hoeflea sp. EC-HK425]
MPNHRKQCIGEDTNDLIMRPGEHRTQAGTLHIREETCTKMEVLTPPASHFGVVRDGCMSTRFHARRLTNAAGRLNSGGGKL